MRENYKSFSYASFLEDLREEIHYSEYTQGVIAKHLRICRETLCRKLNNGELTGKQLFCILVLLGKL